jgi:hypothetical protein
MGIAILGLVGKLGKHILKHKKKEIQERSPLLSNSLFKESGNSSKNKSTSVTAPSSLVEEEEEKVSSPGPKDHLKNAFGLGDKKKKNPFLGALIEMTKNNMNNM